MESHCRATYGFVRLALGFWGKVVRGGFVGSDIPQRFRAPFTASGIYWSLCRAHNLYWDLHCELIQTEYPPWEMKDWLFALFFTLIKICVCCLHSENNKLRSY